MNLNVVSRFFSLTFSFESTVGILGNRSFHLHFLNILFCFFVGEMMKSTRPSPKQSNSLLVRSGSLKLIARRVIKAGHDLLIQPAMIGMQVNLLYIHLLSSYQVQFNPNCVFVLSFLVCDAFKVFPVSFCQMTRVGRDLTI
jgi:hypothetical protein